MVTAGWGILPWGRGAWGSADMDLHIVSALATGPNTVEVTLSMEPMHVTGFSIGDALDPRTWFIMRADTSTSFTILAVREVSSTVFELRVLEPFGSWRVSHRVQSNTLQSVGGFTIIAPRYADFLGVEAEDRVSGLPVNRQYRQRDIANPPTPKGLDNIGGTLIITSGGDYANEEGAALVRKLVIRELFTNPGEFFWLPTWGIGVAEKIPLPASDMVLLKTTIERQIKRNPEVEGATASLNLASDGTLTIKLRVQVRSSGQSIDIAAQVSSAGVSL